MINTDAIESFLIDLELPYERLDEGIWVIVNEDDHGENLVVYLTESLLTLRLKMFDLPEKAPDGIFRRLLELNATSIVHGAFGIENDSVVLVGALEVANLDQNEFQALIDSFSLALGTHHAELSAMLSL